MTRHLRTTFAATVLFASVVACGGGPTIESRDLATIMPSSRDAPPGTTLTADSGPKTLDEFVADKALRTRLKDLGFKLGYQATFLTAGFPDDASKAPQGAALYAAAAVILSDGGPADNALDFYRRRVSRRSKDASPVLNRELGEDAFGFRFSSLDEVPLPGVVFFWRVGNALFSVVGVGNPGPSAEAVRTLARTIDRRARQA